MTPAMDKTLEALVAEFLHFWNQDTEEFDADQYVTRMNTLMGIADKLAAALAAREEGKPANIGEFVIALLIAGGYVTQAKCDEARKIALSAGPYEMPATPARQAAEGGEDFKLQCEVAIAPATIFGIGTSLSSVIAAIKSRSEPDPIFPGPYKFSEAFKQRRLHASPPPSAAEGMEGGDEVVGHKTFSDGHGGFRHEPLTRAEADRLLARCRSEDERRKALMPDEKSAIRMMMDAYTRLKDMGWNDAVYCPKDGRTFEVIEPGSTGIHSCIYTGEWPTGSWWVFGNGDMYPSRPVLFRSLAARPSGGREVG